AAAVEGVDDLLRLRDRRAAEVPAAEAAEEDVLRAPHDALRLPGGAAGVEDVEVVAAPWTEVASRGRARERLLVLEGFDPVEVGARAVVDPQPGGESRQ